MKNVSEIEEFAKFMKDARVKAGYTQTEVAQSLGYSTAQFVSNWERGLSYPPLKALSTLSKMYKVSMDDLFKSILSFTMSAAEESLRRQYKSLKKRKA